MNTSKQIFEKNKRIKKSKLVDVIFTDNLHYTVMDGTKIKYTGHITTDEIYNTCSCLSFYFGMDYVKDTKFTFTSNFFSEHGHTFHCKHIIAAITLSVNNGN